MKVRLQFLNPVPALRKREVWATGETALGLEFVKLLIVEGAEFPRQSAKHSDQRKLRGDDVSDLLKLRVPRKSETVLGFALHLNERIARRKQVLGQIEAAIPRKDEITRRVRDIESATQQITSSANVPLSWHHVSAE